MSYTGISEIDEVLRDLYREQTSLLKALRVKPRSQALIERHRRVNFLIHRLFEFGEAVQRVAIDAHVENT